MEINNYTSPLLSKHVTQNKDARKSEDSGLGIDDFLKLLAAQLANQDMMNPNSDTEFIAQLAQFSSLQAMDSIAKMSALSQSTSLVGKNIVVAAYDSNNNLVKEEGIVEKVTIFGNTPKIYVNGKEYEYSNVMEIKSIAAKTEIPKVEGEDAEVSMDAVEGIIEENSDQGNTNKISTQE